MITFVKERDRLTQFDVLRVIACFLVVLLHGSVKFFDMPTETYSWKVSCGLSSLTRMSVPLFVMMSGYFILGKLAAENATSLSCFYRKSLLQKIGVPLVFWSLIYFFAQIPIKMFIRPDLQIWNPDVFWQNGALGNAQHLWYLYLTAGLYFTAPLLADATKRFSPKVLATITAVWLALNAANLAIVREILEQDGEKSFLVLFGDYLPYFLLGKALGDWSVEISEKWSKLFFCAFLLGTSLIVAGYYYDYGDYAGHNVQPPVALQAIAFYLFVLTVKIRRCDGVVKAQKLVDFLAPLTFGIYLIHILSLMIFGELCNRLFGEAAETYAVSRILSACILAFLFSALVTLILKKIPFLRRVV